MQANMQDHLIWIECSIRHAIFMPKLGAGVQEWPFPQQEVGLHDTFLVEDVVHFLQVFRGTAVPLRAVTLRSKSPENPYSLTLTATRVRQTEGIVWLIGWYCSGAITASSHTADLQYGINSVLLRISSMLKQQSYSFVPLASAVIAQYIGAVAAEVCQVQTGMLPVSVSPVGSWHLTSDVADPWRQQFVIPEPLFATFPGPAQFHDYSLFSDSWRDHTHAKVLCCSYPSPDSGYTCFFFLIPGPAAMHPASPVIAASGTALVAAQCNTETDMASMGDSLQWYKDACEISGVGIWEWVFASNTAMFSDNLLRLIGISTDTKHLPVAQWQELIHPEDLPVLLASMEAYLSGRAAMYRCEHRLRAKDGSYRDILSHGLALYRNPDGSPRRFVGSATDITDVNRRMHIIRDNEQKLYSLMRAIPDNIFIINRSGIIEECYENEPESLVLPSSILVRQDLSQFVPEELHRQGMMLINRVFESGELITVEYPLLIQGVQKYFEARLMPLSRDRILAIVRNVTQQVILQKNITDTMRKYERAQSTAGIGIWERNLETGDTYWSAEVFNILGINQAATTPSLNLFFECMHPDDVDVYKEQFINLTRHGTPYIAYVRFLRNDGGIIYTESRGEAVFQDGIIKWIHGTLYNITEITEAKNEAVRLQNRYRAYIHESPIAIMVCNDKSIITEVNASALRLSGYSLEELCGLHFSQLICSPLEDATGDAHALPGRAASDSRVCLCSKAGARIDITMNTAPVSGNTTIIFIQDISALTASLRELAESNRKLESYFRAIDDMVYFYDLRTHKAVFSNNVRDRLIGRNEQEDEDDQKFWLRHIHPDDLLEYQRKSSEMQTVGFFNHQYRIIDRGGNIRWLWDRAWAVFDGSGTMVRADGIATEITAVKEYEQRIESALAKEQDLNLHRSRIISTLSHEFRTPLAGIYSSAEILETYGATMSPAIRKKQFNQIKSSLHQLRTLLDDVLLINKAESGKLEFVPEPVNITSFVKGLLLSFGAGPARRVKLSSTVRGQYLLDPRLLQQILSNLLSNALKYSSKKTDVLFHIEFSSGSLTFRVTDFGIGIPLNEQDKLYDRFFRASNVLDIEGTGLGMPIVKNALQLHGGAISFISSEREGTTFSVVLPARKVTANRKKG